MITIKIKIEPDYGDLSSYKFGFSYNFQRSKG